MPLPIACTGAINYKQKNFQAINGRLRAGPMVRKYQRCLNACNDACKGDPLKCFNRCTVADCRKKAGMCPCDQTDIYISDLRAHMEMSSPTGTILYRGTNNLEFGKTTPPKQGDTYTAKAFTSTSSEKLSAKTFAKGYLITIEIPMAMRIYDFSEYRDIKNARSEKEILLDIEAKFTITRIGGTVTELGNTFREVEVRVISANYPLYQ